jgi:hypothetical protein
MTDDIVTRLRAEGEMESVGDGTKEWQSNEICQEAADEIERLRNELRKWETTPPNTMVCVKHGEHFMCFDEYMNGVYWCEGCRDD